VEAGDAARRRIKRDLHDGAQSRLVALALLLRSARKRARDDADLAELLDQAQKELQTSLAELRELARGSRRLLRRLRGAGQRAKYARASQASVAVRRVNGRVTVEVADDGVGGADAASGTGLRGLADRVAALDGTLSLDSPTGHGTRLRAEIPLS
jgi:signal transduction histidine kinase